MAKLDPELFQQIRSICEHAGSLVQMGEEEFALSKYYEALALVPDPKSDHSISTFIYTALGEQYFSMKDYAEAGKCFLKAYKCPSGETIGQINLRIGQCLEECGERKKAQDFLCQAFQLGGEALFSGISPKYYKIIRSEIEGTVPEDDEVELLREADEYDIIDDILRVGSSRSTGNDYSGYTGTGADRDVDLYSRAKSGQSSGTQRTSVEQESDDDYGDWDEDYDEPDPYNYIDYSDQDDEEEEVDEFSVDYEAEEDEHPRSAFVRRAREDSDDNEESAWAKIKGAIKKFTDLFN